MLPQLKLILKIRNYYLKLSKSITMTRAGQKHRTVVTNPNNNVNHLLKSNSGESLLSTKYSITIIIKIYQVFQIL